jgi:hypothetical protein
MKPESKRGVLSGVEGRIGGTSYIVLNCLTNHTLAQG